MLVFLGYQVFNGSKNGRNYQFVLTYWLEGESSSGAWIGKKAHIMTVGSGVDFEHLVIGELYQVYSYFANGREYLNGVVA